jgi:hypothetical protein
MITAPAQVPNSATQRVRIDPFNGGDLGFSVEKYLQRALPTRLSPKGIIQNLCIKPTLQGKLVCTTGQQGRSRDLDAGDCLSDQRTGVFVNG